MAEVDIPFLNYAKTCNHVTEAIGICCCCCYFVAKLCPTFCDPMDCSSVRLFIHGIVQARILGWIVISSRGSSSTQGSTPHLLHQQGRIFYHLATRVFLIDICYLGDWSGKLTFLLFLGITNISMIFHIILPWLSQESYFTIWKSLFCFYTSKKNTLTISLFYLKKKKYRGCIHF